MIHLRSEEEVAAAFKGVIRTLERRISAFNGADLSEMTATELQSFLQELEKL